MLFKYYQKDRTLKEYGLSFYAKLLNRILHQSNKEKLE